MLKRGILITVLMLCFIVSVASAFSLTDDGPIMDGPIMVSSDTSVCPGDIYLNGSECTPDTTMVTIEVTGSGTCAEDAPYFVSIAELTESYIVVGTDFSIEPFGPSPFDPSIEGVVENLDGTTAIIWDNIGQYVGNHDNYLTADETFVVTFSVGSDELGEDLPVNSEFGALIGYMYDDTVATFLGTVTMPIPGCVPVDQAYINVKECSPPSPPSVPEFPTVALPLAMVVGLLGIVFAVRRD